MERPHQAGLKRALQEDLAPLDELGNWKPRRLTELTPALFPALFAAQQNDAKLELSMQVGAVVPGGEGLAFSNHASASMFSC